MRAHKARWDIGEIIRSNIDKIWKSIKFTTHQKRMLQALADCRTSALGAHEIKCCDCSNTQWAYNSCRNRNCPKCQGREREKWIRAREKELLPVRYFHVVFTLPDSLNELCLHQPKILYNLLFQAAWYTIDKLVKDPKWLGGKMGLTAVLHTWGQNLSLHPHLHCIVPAGGLTSEGEWKNARSNGKYLFNQRVMSSIFRARFVKLLRQQIDKGKIKAKFVAKLLFKKLFEKEWISYAKAPFLGPKSVLQYLGRYSHKVAITNYRITKVTDEHVYFRWKDYRKKGKQQIMKLDKWTFLVRFSMHIIPHKFFRIRHYGLLSNRNKKQSLLLCRLALKVRTAPPKDTKAIIKSGPENDVRAWCPCCKKITSHQIIGMLPPIRGEPNANLKSNTNSFYKQGKVN